MNKITFSLIMVTTIDGVIAKSSDEFVSWSSKEDKKKFSELTRQIGCVIMGSNTFNTFKKPLPNRINIVLTSKPEDYLSKYSEFENLYFLKVEDIEQLLIFLENLKLKEAAIIGGTQINNFFAKNKLIDYIYLTIEPHIAGKGLNIFNYDLDLKLELQNFEKLNQHTLFFKYKVKK